MEPVDDDLGAIAFSIPQVYVPVVLGPLILEPGIGFVRIHQEVESDFGDMEGTLSVLRLGVGVLFVHAAPDRGRLYVGPRVGILRLASEVEFDGGGADDEARTDLVLAGVAGGEFFLMPAFSLGGEAGLNYMRLGDDGDETSDVSASMISLSAEFRVRWYFR